MYMEAVTFLSHSVINISDRRICSDKWLKMSRQYGGRQHAHLPFLVD